MGTWRIGGWDPTARRSSPHEGYSSVDTWGDGTYTPDGRYRGKFRGFSFSSGRQPGQIPYLGGVCNITIEDWQFNTSDIFVGKFIAIRWDSSDEHGLNPDPDEATLWPKGPPCVFAGLVLSFDTRYPLGVGEHGGDHSITRIVAHDYLGEWAFTTPWVHGLQSGDVYQDNAWGWLQRTRAVRNRCEAVLLEKTANAGIPDDNIATDTDGPDWGLFTAGSAIRAVTLTTATEIFLRHGERLGELQNQGPPAEPDRRRTWYIRMPQMVLRKVGGSTRATAGVNAYNAANWRLTTDDGASQPSSNNVGPQTPGPPSTRRFRAAGRSVELAVNYPPAMDRVTLYSADYTRNRRRHRRRRAQSVRPEPAQAGLRAQLAGGLASPHPRCRPSPPRPGRR